MDNKIDCIVRDALIDETKVLVSKEDIFCKIKEEIKMNKTPNHKHYNFGFGINKHILVAVCLLIVCTTLMFTSSNQVRAFASQTISTIKTIFTVERQGDKLEIVETPINEAKSIPSVSRTFEKSDEEISEKLGFNVSFPEFLGDSFKLSNKSLGVVLRKEIDFESSSELEHDMFNAIEDDIVLKELNAYDPVRNVSGTYRRPDQSTIFINISQSWRLTEIESQMKEFEKLEGFEIKKVKVGDFDGYWKKSLYPEYPFIEENDIGKSDMSVKPEMKEIYSLGWGKSDTVYILNTYNLKLTLEESLKIAEEFMKAN